MKILIITVLSLVVVATNGGLTSAVSRNVPSAYPNIQSAINSSQNGDEVIVSPGTYRENITVENKYISIRSQSGPGSTVLAGNPGRSPAMYLNVPYREGSKNELVGFTITGGYSPDGQGGGITIANNADPVIRSNVIENNQSTSQGGGILVFNNSSPHIRNNTIRNNKAHMFGGVFLR